VVDAAAQHVVAAIAVGPELALGDHGQVNVGADLDLEPVPGPYRIDGLPQLGGGIDRVEARGFGKYGQAPIAHEFDQAPAARSDASGAAPVPLVEEGGDCQRVEGRHCARITRQIGGQQNQLGLPECHVELLGFGPRCGGSPACKSEVGDAGVAPAGPLRVPIAILAHAAARATGAPDLTGAQEQVRLNCPVK
jgi:hypothetical protein